METSEQIDTTNGISSSYACQNCCTGGDTGAYLTPDPMGDIIPQPHDFEAGSQVQYYAFLVHEDCYNNISICETSATDWDTSNSSIATVTQNGLVTIENAGNVVIGAEVQGFINFEGIPCNPGDLVIDDCRDKSQEKSLKESKDEETPQNIIPCGGCDYNPRYFFPEANISADPKIEILRNNQVISNPNTTTNVVVGEKIELTTRVTGGTPTSPQWTVPGDKVKNYVVVCNGSTEPDGRTNCNNPTSSTKTDLSSSDLTQSNIAYYWWKGGNNLQVQFIITINGTQYTKIAKFNVSQPTITNLGINRAIVGIGLSFNRPFLRYGDALQLPGVDFNAQVNSNGIGGTYHWVQTYSESKLVKLATPVGGCSAGRNRVQVGEGLDRTYPYSVDLTLQDSPRIELIMQNSLTSVNDSASSWLMFKPTLTNSIWIPLKKVDWSWGGTANRIDNNNNWNLDPATRSNPDPIDSIPTTFPIWARNISRNSFVCQE